MICKEYDELTPVQKTIFIGELVHAAMNDSDLFRICQKVVDTAIVKGLFNGVQMIPDPIDNQIIPQP